jgi:hypothetical protein
LAYGTRDAAAGEDSGVVDKDKGLKRFVMEINVTGTPEKEPDEVPDRLNRNDGGALITPEKQGVMFY